MKLIETKIEGVFIIENFNSIDHRGEFVKTFNLDLFNEHGLCTEFNESYYSISKKDVIRGMHFQLPPYDHEKLVYVVNGEVLDVILDLRKDSKTYGKFVSIVLNQKDYRSIYIPKGCAHGFKTILDNTIMVYNVSTVYTSKVDSGIKFDSFGFNWDINDPIVSNRDKSLSSFIDFTEINPF